MQHTSTYVSLTREAFGYSRYVVDARQQGAPEVSVWSRPRLANMTIDTDLHVGEGAVKAVCHHTSQSTARLEIAQV